MKNAPLNRNTRVDFLRGVAIAAVLILHFSLSYGLKNSSLGTLLPAWLLKGITRNGNYGVTIFCVISGYLITSRSLQRWGSLRNIDAPAFYLFRFARIMPALLLALAIIVALGATGLPNFANSDGGHHLPTSYFLIAAGSVLTFWHNVLMQSAGYFNYSLNIYWSLSVEEVFYLALPIACLCLRRTGLIVALCCLAIVAGPFYRAAHLDNEIYFMYGYPACFDAIAIGCLAALLAPRLGLAGGARRALRYAAGAALAVVYLRGIDGNEVFGFSLIALASAAFLLGAAGDAAAGWSTGRAAAPLRWLGRHSYELYLFHIIVLGLMRNVLSKEQLGYAARLPWLLLFLALSALAAALVARHVSEPANAAIRAAYARRAAGAVQLP
ncbi:acyltransferase [Janthinobacterium sp.]|uniref:acyltransferase family protein n=1 Tax=Janthinobacterium sp. TaxID=1871054 RepID=UPI00293D9FC6|nr:acyltransferase [Janthinobacterium sp.]